MIFRRSARHDRAEFDRLLDGAAGAPSGDPLARLLSAAAAPGRPDELAGEETALAGFRAARVAAVRPAEPPRRRRPVRAGAVAWVAGVAVTATAGVAFAAAAIERADEPPPPPVTPAPGSGDDRPSEPGGTPTGGTTTGGPSAGASTPGAGSPSARAERLDGLCSAYLAKAPAQRAKALETPAFADLVSAAGGREQVTGYCAARVDEPEPGRTNEPGPQETSEPGQGRTTEAGPGKTAVPKPAKTANPGATDRTRPSTQPSPAVPARH